MRKRRLAVAVLVSVASLTAPAADDVRPVVTVEAGGGLSFTAAPIAGVVVGAALPGLGAGVWLGPRVALTARLAGVKLSGGPYVAWAGPHVQVWPHERFWFGAGFGRRVFGYKNDSSFGYDLRIGTPVSSELNIALEAVPIERGYPTFSFVFSYQRR